MGEMNTNNKQNEWKSVLKDHDEEAETEKNNKNKKKSGAEFGFKAGPKFKEDESAKKPKPKDEVKSAKKAPKNYVPGDDFNSSDEDRKKKVSYAKQKQKELDLQKKLKDNIKSKFVTDEEFENMKKQNRNLKLSDIKKNKQKKKKNESDSEEDSSESESEDSRGGRPNFEESSSNHPVKTEYTENPLNNKGDHKDYLKSNIDVLLNEKASLETGGHEIHGRIFTSAQLQEKIKQNLLFDKYVFNKKSFWKMFLYSLINYIFSPVIGLTIMMEKFGANYIRNRFRHRNS